MYRTISAAFWTDPKVKQLSRDDKLFFLYLITNPHTHVSGIYVLRLSYAAADLGFSVEELTYAMDRVSRVGLCSFDPEKEVVFVHNMFAYQGRGEKVLRSAAFHITEDLHNSFLCNEFLKTYPKVKKFLKSSKKRYGIDRVSGVGTPEQDTYINDSNPVDDSLYINNSNPESDRERGALSPASPSAKKRKQKAAKKTAKPVEPEPPRLPFGEFKRALLSEDEMAKLKQALNGHHEEYIERFDRWVNEAPGAKKDGVRRIDRHAYESIRAWYSRDLQEGRVKEVKQEKTIEQMTLELKQRHGLR